MSSFVFRQHLFLNVLQQSRLRRAFAWLVVAALLLRGLMPPGFMPDIGRAADAFPIKICSSFGIKTILVAAADFASKGQKPIATEDAMRKHHDCLLCAPPLQATGGLPAVFLHFILFFVAAFVFISCRGKLHRRYEVVAVPRAPPPVS